jgi:hypothetical protein
VREDYLNGVKGFAANLGEAYVKGDVPNLRQTSSEEAQR